jgi:hypothetical protein
MNVGYCPEYGTARFDRRTTQLTSAAFYYSSYKMYPKLINGGTLSDGDRIEAVLYRIMSSKVHPDLTVVNWYWVNQDMYLFVAAHKDVDTYLELPIYMDGFFVSIIEISEGAVIPTQIVAGSRIRVKMMGESNYVILKLTNQ